MFTRSKLLFFGAIVALFSSLSATNKVRLVNDTKKVLDISISWENGMQQPVTLAAGDSENFASESIVTRIDGEATGEMLATGMQFGHEGNWSFTFKESSSGLSIFMSMFS